MWPLAALGLGLGLALGGCDPPPSLRLGTNVWPGYEPFYLAREDGALPPTVSLVELVSATQVQRAFRIGQLDAAAVTLDEALRLAEATHDVMVVAVLDESHGADAIVGRPELATLDDLRGRRVGVERTALGAYVLARAIERLHAQPSDFHTEFVTIAEQEARYRAGDLDAVITFEPVRTQLRADGAHDLLTSADMPGEIVDVLIVRRSFAEAHRDLVASLVGAWFRVRERVIRDPGAAASRMTGRLGLAPSDAADALAGITFPDEDQSAAWIEGRAENGGLPVIAPRLVSIMQRVQLFPESVDAARLSREVQP